MAHQLPTTIPFVNRTPAHGLETRTARGGRARRKVGVKDVAREAGVSLGTVSNVLNHPEVVAEATRKRVLDVIGSIGYVRAQGAQQVDGLASRVIAVLGLNGADPYFTALATGVEQAAREAGLGVMVCTGTREAAEDGRHLALIAAHRIRGAVLVSGEGAVRAAAALRRHALPFVMADQYVLEPAACSVGIDDVAGGYAAVRHLLAQGHRSVVHVGGPYEFAPIRERRTGARRAISRAGLASDSLHELSCPGLTVGAGKDAGQRILGLADRPTAVFCADDLLALGVMQALYEAGLRVPDDIALVGYGDLDFAASAVVPLTTVRRPVVAMGRQAGRLLIEDTAHNAVHGHVHVVLQPELVVRRSTLAAPAR